MTIRERLAQLAQQMRRADQVERVAVALADALDTDPDQPLPVDVIADALTRAHEIVMLRRLEAGRQKTAERRAAGDSSTESGDPDD